ncbi:hypothetical protein ABFS83_11G104000 [Erythranthe nasuta]
MFKEMGKKKKSVLTDDQWREIQYAVECAVSAIADPTPQPDPPGQRWVQRKEEILDEQPQRIDAPIPVPRDWKPYIHCCKRWRRSIPFLNWGNELIDCIIRSLRTSTSGVLLGVRSVPLGQLNATY